MTATQSEINVDCLRAAEQMLRTHDSQITAAGEELKRLRRERVPLAERVQHCIDVLCGRATPDLFTPPADVPVSEPLEIVSPRPPAEQDVTPPLAPGETVELAVVRASVLTDIAAVYADEHLRAIAELLAAKFQVLDVGDLWDWLDEDYRLQGGMSRHGLEYMLHWMVGGPETADSHSAHHERFAETLFGFLAANGHEPKPAEPTATPGPVVCKPVGEGLLRDIDGVTHGDALKMEAKNLRTLTDLEQRCNGDASNSRIYGVLVLPKGPLSGPDADRVANAITRHLNPATVLVDDPEPKPGEDNDPPPVKGERIESLGVSLEDLETAYSLAGAEYGKEVVVNKTVTVNGRRHVKTSASYFGQTERTYDLLPLYTLAEFAERHPDVATYSTLTPVDPKGRGGRAPGEYGGLMVSVGRGKSKEVLVVGVKGEQRRLLWVKTVDPFAPKAAKEKKQTKPTSKKRVKQ